MNTKPPYLKKIFRKKKILLLIIVLFVLTFSLTILLRSGTMHQFINRLSHPSATTSYEELTAEQAYVLIQNARIISIVDVRGCECSYNDGHLPNATWHSTPQELYDSTEDLLIYSHDNDTESTLFCTELLSHVYGNIYRLTGGYLSWENAGYRIEK